MLPNKHQTDELVMKNKTADENDQYGVPVHVFQKSKTEQVRISINEYRGHEYIDIRIFYLSDDDKFLPTKKGVTVKKDLYPELLAGVVQLGETLGFDLQQETTPEAE